jgi:nitrate/nitrite transporter NarK
VVLDDQQPARAARRRAGADQRPPALWGDFPLSEIVVFVGILLLITGFFVSPPQGFVMIAVGLVLGSLAGLELSIREHFAGFRSHTLLLSAAVAVPLFGVLFLATHTPTLICVALAAGAFAGSAWLFANAFRRRSGGALFRLGS